VTVQLGNSAREEVSGRLMGISADSLSMQIAGGATVTFRRTDLATVCRMRFFAADYAAFLAGKKIAEEKRAAGTAR
jgi:hypothetical protein